MNHATPAKGEGSSPEPDDNGKKPRVPDSARSSVASPYRNLLPGAGAEATGPLRRWLTAVLWRGSILLAGLGLGAVFGLVTSVIIGLAFDPANSTGGLSYGQEFASITVPLCTAIGAGIGFSVGFTVLRYRVVSIVCLTITAVAGWLVNSSLWNSQIASYGRDPSEATLYFPPVGMCVLAGVIAVLVLRGSEQRRTRPGGSSASESWAD